jgi:hypothetical protein
MAAAKGKTGGAGTKALSGDDPRVLALLESFAKDPARSGVIDTYEAGKAKGGPPRFGSNGLKVGGKLFALFTQGRLVVKLPRERVTALVAENVGEPFDPGHGRLMKEWLSVTSARASWLDLARESHDFVQRRGR